MPANIQITGFKTRVDTSIRDLDQLNGEMIRFSQTLTKAAQVVKAVDDTGDVAGFIRKASEDQLLVLKLTKQATPLSGPSEVMETAIKLIKPVAERIEKTVDRLNLKKDSKDPDNQQDEDGEFLSKLETALSRSAMVLDTTVELLELQRQSMSDLSGTMGRIVNAMDTATIGGSGTFAFPGDRQKSIDLKADFDGLNFEVATELEQRNVLVDDIRADYLEVRQQFADILSIMDQAKLDLSLTLDVDMSAIEGFFSVLAGPLDAAAAALQPVEGLLNSVGALVDLVLGPVFAFLEATLGIDKLLEDIAEDIAEGLPDPAIFDDFEAQVQAMLDDLRTFINDNFCIEAFIDALEVATFGNAIGDAQQGTIGTGTDRGNTLSGDDLGDVLDARGGDDTIDAMGGNDIILATAGDDNIDGGAGDDMLFFDASFSEFELSRDYREDEDGNVVVNDIVVTHTAPEDGDLSLGSERFRNIEWVVFNNITFTGEELENATIGSTLLEGDRADVNDASSANTFVRDDLIFLNSDGDPNADGTADGLHEAAGYGGDDRIFGSTTSDLLRGGIGDDILIPGQGDDVVQGDAGNDSFQALSEGSRSIEYKIDLIEGISRSQFGTDTLVTIENTIIQARGDHEIRGDRSANRILTAGGLDIIDGRDGDDYIEAAGGKDVLIGGQGRDYLNGGDGPDVLIVAGDAVAGGEVYDGAAGSDTLLYTHTEGMVKWAAGGDNQVIRNGYLNAEWLLELDETTGSVRIDADTGLIQRYSDSGTLLATDRSYNIESFGGSMGNDTIYSYSFEAASTLVNPSIEGSGGDDTIFLRGGDAASGGGGDDKIYIDHWNSYTNGGQNVGGGDGQDTLDVRPGGDLRWEVNIINATTFNIFGHLPSTGSGSAISNRNPEYRLSGGLDLDLIKTGDNDDLIIADIDGDSAFTFETAGGNDEIIVTGGNFTLIAGSGDDKGTFNNGGTFEGGAGADYVTFDASAGNRQIGVIDLGADDDYARILELGYGSASGGDGYDTLSSESSRGLDVDLLEGTLADKISGTQYHEINITIDGFERVITSGNADSVKGSHRAEVIVTKSGADTITAGSGDDQIYGGNGNDTIRGEAGDDLIHGGPGTNLLDGGSGRNTLSYDNVTPDNFEGNLVASWFTAVNVDMVTGRATGTNLDDNFDNFRDVIGTRLSDSIRGDDHDNVLSGGLGSDTMFGGSGNDYLLAGEGNDSLSGESGDDTIAVERGIKTIDGGSGTDTLDLGASGGRLVLDLAKGTYTGTMAVDMPDWLDPDGPALRTFNNVTMSPLDVLRADPLHSLSQADKARVLPTKSDPEAGQFALANVTQLLSASGTFSSVENFIGSQAETFVRFSLEVEQFDGRRGDNDWIYMHNEEDGFTYDLATGATNLAELQGDTLLGMEHLWGGNGNDVLSGDDGANKITGGRGGDWITTGDGSDTIDGGDGRDMISFVSLADTAERTNSQYRLDLDLGEGRATTSGDDVYQISNIERVTGTIFADRIKGDAGDNELRGLGDYDWFIATTGADTLDGGTGQDMISYVDWQNDADNTADPFNDGGAPPANSEVTGVVVDLNDTTTNTNLAAGHTYIDIERITGSGRQDVFYGDDNENDFRGLGDYDWFVSSTGGRERYFGGDGIDTVTYYNASAGVSAGLSNGARVGGQETGRGTAGDAALDLFFSIEGLVGTNFDDTLSGSSGRNNLSGLDGDDIIYGYAGIDQLKGGSGDDMIDGGGGSDYALYDGSRADFTLTKTASNMVTISGADGTDTLVDVEYFRFADGDVTIWELSI